jgi:hypothetical protein
MRTNLWGKALTIGPMMNRSIYLAIYFAIYLMHSVSAGATSAPPADLARSPRETAVRRLGVVPFSVQKDSGIAPAQDDQLVRQVANDLSAMSYVDATPIDGSTKRSARAALLKSVADANLDGVLIGEVASDHFTGVILSRSGDTLAKFDLPLGSSLANESQVKAFSKAIIDEVARAIPYRGFVTRQTGDDRYEINLGKSQGILKGQRFRLFDFTTSSFKSDRRDMGEVEVVDVAESTATVEPTGLASEIKPFMKIGFNEKAHGMSIPQQVETRGFAVLGGGLLNISGSGDPKYVDRAYNVSSTPGFLLGGGWNKFSTEILFAQASGDQTDLVYTEILVDDQILETAFGGLNRFSVLAGGRINRVSITTKRGVVTPLESTTSVSPQLVARLDRIIKGPVRGFIDASAYFPIYVSGMQTSALLFSYGIGGDTGLSLDLSQRLFLDVGARYHLIRRPVEGQSSVQEILTEFFADLGFRF